MGETVLVRPLTPAMIAGGEALLRRLDQDGIPIVSAFWLYDEEGYRWKLVLATPVDDVPLLYRKTRLALEEVGEQHVAASDVAFVGPDDWDVKRYGYQVWRGPLPENMIVHVDSGVRHLYRFLPQR